jgi:hypothetical protein
MPVVTTTTESNGFGFPVNTLIERAPNTGHLWLVFRSTTTQVSVWRSIDNGTSFQVQGTFSRTGLYDISDARIDQAGDHIHVIYLVSESSLDKVFYKRLDIRSGNASFSSGEIQVTATANAGSARSVRHAASCYPYKNPDGSYSILVIGSYHQASDSGVDIYAVSVKNDGSFTTYLNPGLVHPYRRWALNGFDSTLTCSVDVEHNGDAYTTSTPNVWLSFMIFGVTYAIKLTWQGYKSGWSSPGAAPVVALNRLNATDLPGRWDGRRFVVLSLNPSDTTKIDVFERDGANTKNLTTRTTPSHTTGIVTSWMLSYNHVTQDLRVFAAGTSTGVLYYVDYIRATATWGSWTVANATAVSPAGEWSVRRGTYGSGQYDVYMQNGTTPWNITTYVLTVNFAPTAPTWITGAAGTPITNGAAFDVSASLTLDWTFNDPNPTDSQATFALSRQIGAATIQWWRTSDSTWQLAETFNTSSTSALTLAAANWVGAGGAADLAHVYKVRVTDAGGGLQSAYSAGLSIVPSTRVDPTLTAPTPAQVLNSGQVTATWTVTEQAAYRVTVTNTATSAVTSDSGWLTDPTPLAPSVLSYTVPVVLANGYAGSLTLQTRNAEGLASVIRTDAFSVVFVEPVAPIVSVLVADPVAGGNDVTVTQAAATGTQPATTRMDLYRRKVVATAATNANPNFETNTTDWTNQGYTSMVRSTAQFHQGTASMLMTPTGAAATPYVQSGSYTTVGGQRWEQRGWFYSTTANKTVRVKLQWFDVGVTLISESVRDYTPVAGVWVWVTNSAAAPSTAVGVRWAIGQLATPAVGDTLYTDEAVLMPANDDLGIRIGYGITPGTLVLDWRAVTGINYEYRGYALAGNQTQSYGPWVA